VADLGTIFVAAVGFGAGGEAMRRYRRFKNRRRTIPREVRNAGFWTDGRLYLAELVFSAMLLAIPWTAVLMAVATNHNLWLNFVALLTYPAAIFIFMRNMNMREPQ
jgi:hypothetical protein